MSQRVLYLPGEHKPERKGELFELVVTDALSSFGKREIHRDRIRSNPILAPLPVSKFEEWKYPTPKVSSRPFPTLRTCNWPRYTTRNCTVSLVSRNSPQSKVRPVVGNLAIVLGKELV